MSLPSLSPIKAKRRIRAYRAGLLAEWAAVILLFFKGYRVLACRYKTSQGEVDILAIKGDVLAAVEVKARKSRDSAIEAVGITNRRRVEKAAMRYIAHKNLKDATLRFDIVAVRLWGGIVPISCKHLDNAWQADTYF